MDQPAKTTTTTNTDPMSPPPGTPATNTSTKTDPRTQAPVTTTTSINTDPRTPTSDIATTSINTDPRTPTSDIATTSTKTDPRAPTSDIATTSINTDPRTPTSDIAITNTDPHTPIPDIATTSINTDPRTPTSDIAITNTDPHTPIPDIATTSTNTTDPRTPIPDIATTSTNTTDPRTPTSDIASTNTDPKLTPTSTCGSSFVRRLHDLPPLSDALSLAAEVYAKSKDYRGLGVMVGVAESSLRAAAGVTLPLAAPVVAGIGGWASMDEWACHGLDAVENFLPVLKEPTSQVVGEARDRMLGMVAGSSSTPLSSLTSALTFRAVSTATSLAESRGGVLAAGVAHRCLDHAHHLVDTILPESDQGPQDSVGREWGLVVRIAALTTTASRRLLYLASFMGAVCETQPSLAPVAKNGSATSEVTYSGCDDMAISGHLALKVALALTLGSAIRLVVSCRALALKIMMYLKVKMDLLAEDRPVAALLAILHYYLARLAHMATRMKGYVEVVVVKATWQQKKKVNFAM